MAVATLPAAPPPLAVRVYWEDTDAGGIVYYANYLKFFERARTEWLRQHGVQQQHMREAGQGMFVVTEAQVRYLRPARLDDALLVHTTPDAAATTRARMVLHQRVCIAPPSPSLPPSLSPDSATSSAPGASPADLLCEATIHLAWVDARTHRAARLPAHLLQTLCLS